MKFMVEVDLDPGDTPVEDIERQMRLGVQRHLLSEDLLLNTIRVKQSMSKASLGIGGTGTPGRKPVNRPKVENWIRENVTAGASTQGTVGLAGVDREGKPLKDAPNRVYAHRLAYAEPEGTGLSLVAIDKVLRELETEGYLERGFAAGAPFYELIRPLEAEGLVGVRGRAIDDPIFLAPPATERWVDFSTLEDEDIRDE